MFTPRASWRGPCLKILLLATGGAMGFALALVFFVPAKELAVGPWEELALKAAATHGSDGLVMASGPVADEADGVFFIDPLTGNLRGAVMNVRAKPPKFTAYFHRNVLADLNIRQGEDKLPRFLLVIGKATFPGNTSGGGIVYVANATTGRFAAYGIPFVRDAYVRGVKRADPLILLDAGQARVAQEQE